MQGGINESCTNPTGEATSSTPQRSTSTKYGTTDAVTAGPAPYGKTRQGAQL